VTASPEVTASPATTVIAALTERKLTIAVAESLTGGLLVSSLVAVPGASKVVLGGVVAYNTAIKASVLGVDRTLLEARGAVDPDVATQMASGVRTALAVDGRPADIGIATTGVAGPDIQDGKPVGTAFIGIATAAGVVSIELAMSGDRDTIRSGVVSESLVELTRLLARTAGF